MSSEMLWKEPFMNTGRPLLLILLSSAALVAMGCKRSSNTSSGPSTSVVGSSAANSGASSDSATAVGPGAVNVTGNVVTYQNVHVEVPWNVSDVAAIVKMSQQAAAGSGLR